MKKSSRATEKERVLTMPLSSMKSFMGKTPKNNNGNKPSLVDKKLKKKS